LQEFAMMGRLWCPKSLETPMIEVKKAREVRIDYVDGCTSMRCTETSSFKFSFSLAKLITELRSRILGT